jgi:hypothetical protein
MPLARSWNFEISVFLRIDILPVSPIMTINVNVEC